MTDRGLVMIFMGIFFVGIPLGVGETTGSLSFLFLAGVVLIVAGYFMIERERERSIQESKQKQKQEKEFQKKCEQFAQEIKFCKLPCDDADQDILECCELNEKVQEILDKQHESFEQKYQYLCESKEQIDSLLQQQKSLLDRYMQSVQTIAKIRQKYALPGVGQTRLCIDKNIVPLQYVHHDLQTQVLQYNQKTSDLVEQMIKTEQLVLQLLNPTCESAFACVQQLEQDDEKIKTAYNEYFSLQKDFDDLKIKIDSGAKQKTVVLSKAFEQIFQSQKSSRSVKNLYFDQSAIPCQLNLFSFESKPLLLSWDEYIIAVFATCVLIFDQQGLFLSVAKANALVFVAKEISDVVTFVNERCDHKYISNDSRCISHGIEKTTYRYTCKDGSKDRRYSYNPSTTTRTDKCAHGSLKIGFLNQEKQLYFSNNKAIDTLKSLFKN